MKLGISDWHNVLRWLSFYWWGGERNQCSQTDQKLYNALLLWGLSFIIPDIYKCPQIVSYSKIICCKTSQKLLNTDINTLNLLKSTSDTQDLTRKVLSLWSEALWRLLLNKITVMWYFITGRKRSYFHFTVVPCKVQKTATENSLEKLSGK